MADLVWLLAGLQARGEELQDGQRIAAVEDPDHTQRFLELRLRARGIATHFVAGVALGCSTMYSWSGTSLPGCLGSSAVVK